MSQTQLPHHERIKDANFRRAVDLIDQGAFEPLREHLENNPQLITQRVQFGDDGYFSSPCLLEFVAENPIRHGRLPANIVAITRLILECGAKDRTNDIDATLDLVGSGRIVRECGVQQDLIALLCEFNANPDTAMFATIAHAEFEAARCLIQHGAKVNLVVASALGDDDKAKQLLHASTNEQRHKALAMCTMHGHLHITRLLLEAREAPDRFNPPGFHAHSTPLHQAALAGHEEIVHLLIDHGANSALRDTLHDATASVWARHGGHETLEKYLASRE